MTRPPPDLVDRARAENAAAADERTIEPDALNERIAQALLAAVRRGDYPLGATLPTEAALCTTWGASRFTVREALRKLADLGLIERRRGAGTRVVATTPRVGFSQTFRDLAEIFQYARDTRLVVSDVRMSRLTAEEAELVGAPAGSLWLRLEGLRWTGAGDAVIAHVTAFVHARFAPLLEDVRETTGAVYALIEARSGESIAEAVQEIAALPTPADLARVLGVRRGAPAMRLVRRYLDDSGGTMMTSVNWHASSGFTYRMRLRRGDWQARADVPTENLHKKTS